jgi:myo-inositol 2-dehydrogenase/D-chiro-inositol 1-dehydrogenase
MADPLRVLVIGAGRMGAVHLASLDSATFAKAVAVVEPVATLREQAHHRGLAAYESLDDALGAGGFDAALIAAPSDLHLGLVRRLMSERVPTLCEKPCGLRSVETSEAVGLAADAGVVLQIGYWRRFVPALRQLRERVGSGELGELALVQAWQWDAEPPSADFRARSGGIVRDMGVHEFDQIRWITGQELSIAGLVESSVTSDPPVENDPESVAIIGAISGGGVALISLGRRFGRGDSCWLEVIGTRDVARCEFMSGSDGDQVFRAALVDQVEAFAAAVGGRRGDAATAEDAVAALRAAEQASPLPDPWSTPRTSSAPA